MSDRSHRSFHLLMSRKLPFVLLFCLFAPEFSVAQQLGQVACSRPGDYVYLYSSMTTLEVRSTLQCGQEVIVTGRYDSYFAVRTDKGEIGYVPQASLSLMKTNPGEKIVLPTTAAPNRERTPYDESFKPAEPASNAASARLLILRDSTPIRMKLLKPLSSATAQVGDDVSLEVSDDVVVDGFLLVPKGSVALGVVNEAEPRKALGRGGKLGVLIRSVRLADGEQAVLRSGSDAKGSNSTAGVVIPVMHGKDITFPKGMDFVGYVNGDTRLDRVNFHSAPQSSSGPSTPQ